MNSYYLPNICVFCKLYCLLHVLHSIVFSMFFMLSVRSLCSIVLLHSLAILNNLILFFMYPTHTELLLNISMICLYLCLFNLIRWCYVYVPGGTYTQWTVVLNYGPQCITISSRFLWFLYFGHLSHINPTNYQTKKTY